MMSVENQVRGLDEEETDFLDFVSNKQQEVERARQMEDEDVMNEYRNTVQSRTTTTDALTAKKPSAKTAGAPAASNSKQQKLLLAGAVKRKSSSGATDESPETKKAKTSAPVPPNAPVSPPPEPVSPSATGGTMAVIGRLPGLGAYIDSDDEEETSDSRSEDSDIETDMFKTAVRMHIQQTSGGAAE